MPRLSWILPVYNGEEYIRETLQSIQAQHFSDYEVLVLDDGSTDGTAEIVAAFTDQDLRFKHIRKSNTGLIDTLNVGIDLCAGQYVARIDADDICMPQRSAVQVAFLDANSNCILVASRAELIDSAGKTIRLSDATRRTRPARDGFPPERWPIRHPTVMGRTAAFRALGGYDARFPAAEDYELWTRMRLLGQIHELPDYLIKYRYHSSSESSRKSILQAFSVTKADFKDYRRSKGDSESTLDIISSMDSIDSLIAYMTVNGDVALIPKLQIHFLTLALSLVRHRLPAQESTPIALGLRRNLLQPHILWEIARESGVCRDGAQEFVRFWLTNVKRKFKSTTA